jgi:hypothetical protein
LKQIYRASDAGLGIGEDFAVIRRMVLCRDRSDGSQAIADIVVLIGVKTRDAYVRVKWGSRRAGFTVSSETTGREAASQATWVHRRMKVYSFWGVRAGLYEGGKHGKISEDNLATISSAYKYAEKLRERNFWMAALSQDGVWMPIKDTWRIPNSKKSPEMRAADLNEKFQWVFD